MRLYNSPPPTARRQPLRLPRAKCLYGSSGRSFHSVVTWGVTEEPVVVVATLTHKAGILLVSLSIQ